MRRRMVGGGPKEDVIAHPQHPHTKLLIDSSPGPARATADRAELFGADAGELGEPPSLIDPPAGCRFHPRCPVAMDVCRTQAPPRTELSHGQWAHCRLTELREAAQPAGSKGES
ncbi:oligopeptide/dipeptide ABC transporter ATP-binding protein [Jiangella endophytica]|uniref:oligopeptide/dipeptide ABC transporter ATP-binding protein n=1 Tax=Jiangella endophytica TaxID=1623398 RepID=UPI000E342365|nr:oligopeptide/dipeptide ABC transporter ATP-binding protein [Jiangella endophytica]